MKGWEGFKRLPLWGRAVISLLAAAVAIELAMSLAAPLGGGSGRGGSSSYSTKGNGLGAYAELLAKAGHRVERTSDTLDQVDLPPEATVIVARTTLANDEADALRVFVGQGGRLVLAGRQPDRVVQRLIEGQVSWGAEAVPVMGLAVPVPETVGVGMVAADTATDVIRDAGPALPVVAGTDAAMVAVTDIEAGRVVLLGSASPLTNDVLAQADNASMGLAIVGPPDRPVHFAEAGSTGGGRGTGLDAIPDNWRWALMTLAVSVALAMWSAARRFGPPEDEARDLPPPRKAYVDAVAATLAKTKQPDAALAPLRRAARERLARRAVLPVDADDGQLRRAAAELGLPPDEIDALFGAVTEDDKAMAMARAMARLGGPEW